MFLVKGHTTYKCDSKFNSLKGGTRGVNIYTERGFDLLTQRTILRILSFIAQSLVMTDGEDGSSKT